jgi:hypothetical protein
VLPALFILPQGFNQFELSSEQAASLITDFSLLIPESELYRCGRVDRVIADYKQVPGIHFWVMRHEERLFRIYIGKTISMSYRMQNYVSEFQPHSPNDYKLRIFRAYISDVAPSAKLDLHFSSKDLADLTKAENIAVAAYDPLLNRRQRPSAEARSVLREAFSVYYRSAFERILKNGA